jgi:imidazolonepropionase-like amidohydrolase
MSVLALAGGTIYGRPREEPIRNGTLLIENGTIAAAGSDVQVPQGARTLDCSACTITAGFWNSHVHFFERKWVDAANIPAAELAQQLTAMLTRYGFTSAFDLSSMWANTQQIRTRIESGEVPGPRIRTTGEGLIPPGALPPDAVLGIMGTMKTPLPEIADAVQAATVVRALLETGVDGVKLFASSQRGDVLAGGAIAAAAQEAHRAGKPVFIHPNTGADILAGVRGGVDVIAHTTPHSGPWDDTLVQAMKDAGVALTPTLALWKYFLRHDRVSTQQRVVGTAVDQLRAWVACGGTVLFGTDLGAVDPDPSEEYALMSAAGMSFEDILESLTAAPAERFGESRRLGRIAPGYRADVTIFKDALHDVQYTIRDGNVIYSSK